MFNLRISTTSRLDSKSSDRVADQINDGRARSSRTESSFHQKFHRTAYERKKQDYQRERAEHRSYERPMSYLSNSSTTHYQRLNIQQGANIDAIKSAYYSLSKQYHPDIVGKDNPDATENFRLITESYDTLSDPTTRAEYDKQLTSEVEPRHSPTNSSWSPSGSGNRDNETIFRMQETNRIFRTKQEEALEREKVRNPAKFRAGSFKYEEDKTASEDLARIENQIRSVTSARSFKGRESDSGEFYRVHLYDTLQRRKIDLEEIQYYRSSPSSTDGTLLVSLASIIGVIAFAILSVVNLFYEIDLAGLLDSQLEQGFDIRGESRTDPVNESVYMSSDSGQTVVEKR